MSDVWSVRGVPHKDRKKIKKASVDHGMTVSEFILYLYWYYKEESER